MAFDDQVPSTIISYSDLQALAKSQLDEKAQEQKLENINAALSDEEAAVMLDQFIQTGREVLKEQMQEIGEVLEKAQIAQANPAANPAATSAQSASAASTGELSKDQLKKLEEEKKKQEAEKKKAEEEKKKADEAKAQEEQAKSAPDHGSGGGMSMLGALNIARSMSLGSIKDAINSAPPIPTGLICLALSIGSVNQMASAMKKVMTEFAKEMPSIDAAIDKVKGDLSHSVYKQGDDHDSVGALRNMAENLDTARKSMQGLANLVANPKTPEEIRGNHAILKSVKESAAAVANDPLLAGRPDAKKILGKFEDKFGKEMQKLEKLAAQKGVSLDQPANEAGSPAPAVIRSAAGPEPYDPDKNTPQQLKMYSGNADTIVRDYADKAGLKVTEEKGQLNVSKPGADTPLLSVNSNTCDITVPKVNGEAVKAGADLAKHGAISSVDVTTDTKNSKNVSTIQNAFGNSKTGLTIKDSAKPAIAETVPAAAMKEENENVKREGPSTPRPSFR